VLPVIQPLDAGRWKSRQFFAYMYEKVDSKAWPWMQLCDKEKVTAGVTCALLQ
jgi:hypothetical protein